MNEAHRLKLNSFPVCLNLIFIKISQMLDLQFYAIRIRPLVISLPIYGCPALASPVFASPVEQEQINNPKGWTMMTMTSILNTLIRLRDDESAQGLVEYLLILALIAFAATAGMSSLASGLNSAFSQIGLILGSYIT